MLRAHLLQPRSRHVIEAGTRGAWRALEAKLRPFVSRRVHREADVDDVIQEVFLRMQRGLPGLRDEQRFGPWVYQVARSALADQHRSAARHPLAAEASSAPEGLSNEAGDDETDESARLLASSLTLFVAALPSPYREALTLTELEGMSQKDAAELLGISLSGMKSRVQRGRQRLRAALEDCCHIALDARGRVVDCRIRGDARLPERCCAQADPADSCAPV